MWKGSIGEERTDFWQLVFDECGVCEEELVWSLSVMSIVGITSEALERLLKFMLNG